MGSIGALALSFVIACSGSKDSAPAADKGKAEKGSGEVKPVEDFEEESVKSHLRSLGEKANDYQRSKGTFLEGKVGATPAKACCDQPKGECYQQDSDWSDPVWTALGFKETKMYTRYRYAYEGERLSFTATATADVGCDGKAKTFQIKGSYDADNMARITEPELVIPVEKGVP